MTRAAQAPRTDAAPVLMLSSWVSAGHVGLSAGGPALHALGATATLLPTVMLSNHPGFPAVHGQVTPPETLDGFCDALDANGWLAGHNALLVGYMPTPEHVTFAAGLAARLPGVRVVVDPIIGDHPKGLYVPEPVARAIRDQLLPLADVLTPNRFELGWLTGLSTDTPEAALRAAEHLRAQTGATILLTSPPFDDGQTGVIEVGAQIREFRSPLMDDVPHGVGDVFAALIAGGLPAGAALGHVAALARASRGAPHLKISETAPDWTAAPPLSPEKE